MTIEKPEIKSSGDIYLLHWPVQKIKMKLDRLLEINASLSGEIVISQERQGGDLHLYHARLNLLSPQSKKALANELSQRIDLDWQTMIEQACVLALREYRRGEPIIKVGTLPQREMPRFRLKPFILEKEISALYAYGGSGKSIVTDLFSLMVQCGLSLMGMETIKGNALILDWESSPEAVDEIIKAIKKGMKIESPETPLYRRCHRILPNEIGQIQSLVLANNIQLVIVDSAGMAAGLAGDYHSPAIEMLRALRSLQTSVLIIDHKPKEGDSMFGSVYKTNECRATWELRASQEEDSYILNIGLFHSKHNLTKKFKPWGFEITFFSNEDITDEIIFKRVDVADLPEIGERLSASTRILNLLKEGKYKPTEIAILLDLKEGTVNTALTRLKQANKITKLQDGSYGLSYEE